MENRKNGVDFSRAIQVPEFLFEREEFWSLSTDAKVIYALILRKYLQTERTKKVDAQGVQYTEFRANEVMEFLKCSSTKAAKIFKDLEKYGLIIRRRLPRNASRLYIRTKFE